MHITDLSKEQTKIVFFSFSLQGDILRIMVLSITCFSMLPLDKRLPIFQHRAFLNGGTMEPSLYGLQLRDRYRSHKCLHGTCTVILFIYVLTKIVSIVKTLLIHTVYKQPDVYSYIMWQYHHLCIFGCDICSCSMTCEHHEGHLVTGVVEAEKSSLLPLSKIVSSSNLISGYATFHYIYNFQHV